MAAQTAFRVGELVVHPAYGFSRIAGIERAHGRGGLEDCYVFRMGSVRNPIKILMPVAQAEASGLRCPITREQAEAVLRVFELPPQPLGPASREQLEVISARLGSGDLCAVAAAIRDLVASGVDGRFGQTDGTFVNRRRSERMMLGSALERLIDEVARVQRLPRTQIEARIQACLRRKRKARTIPALAT